MDRVLVENSQIENFGKTPEANEFASFIESLNQETFNRLLDNIPEAIIKREPYEFSDFNEVKAVDLQHFIK